MNIIKHVVADLEQIRALLQHQAEKSRQWQDDEGVVEIDEKYVDDVIKRLGADIVALCHAIDPNQHSTTVRKDAVEAKAELPATPWIEEWLMFADIMQEVTNEIKGDGPVIRRS